MYDPSKVPRSFAKNIANLFARVITNIVANPQQALRSLEASITSPLFTFSATDIARTVTLRAASQIEVTRNSIEDIHPVSNFWNHFYPFQHVYGALIAW
jgi:hypothetical protein